MEQDLRRRQRKLLVGSIATATDTGTDDDTRRSGPNGSRRAAAAAAAAAAVQPNVEDDRFSVRSSLRIPYRWWRCFALSMTMRNSNSNSSSSAPSLMVAAQIICLSCALWILLFLLVGGTATAKDLYASLFPVNDKGAVPMLALVLPTLIAGTFASLWSIRRPEVPVQRLQQQHQQHSSYADASHQGTRWATPRGRLGHVVRRYCRPSGDPDFRQWGFLAIVLPCVLFAASSVYRKAVSATTTATAVAESGNAFGITALVAMSILLIPVARHGHLLDLWGWNPAAAIQLHICAGRCVMVMVLLHGGCHIWHWIMLSEHVVPLLGIPWQCWTSQTAQPNCVSKLTDCSCYAHARNFTGLVGALALLVIAVTTLNTVRRRLYTLFYKIHMLAGPTVVVCTILHWNRSIVYLAGALLYYVACSCPTWLEQLQRSRSNAATAGGGVQIISVERISDSGDDGATITESNATANRPCLALTFAASDAAVNRYRAGQYIKLRCCTHISNNTSSCSKTSSSLWHPFTVNLVPNQARQLRLIVRCTGPFTSQLLLLAAAAATAPSPLDQFVVDDDDDIAATTTTVNGSQQSSNNTTIGDDATLPPVVHLDGFYGCPFRVEQVLRHDVVVIVAGGVGITPYLSLIHKVHTLTLEPRRLSTTRRIALHWTCRDTALIAFVQREYIDVWVNAQAEVDESSPPLQLQIFIHQTDHRSVKKHEHSNRTNGRATSYTDLENPQDCEVKGCQVKHSLTTVPSTASSMHHANCVPFTPSRFSLGSKSSVKGNAASFVSFALTVWVGLVGVWYLYRNKATKSSIFPRIYAPIFILAWALVVSLTVHWLFAERILARYCGVHENDAGDPISTSWDPLFGNESTTSEPGRIERYASSELGELELSVCNPDSIADGVVGDRRDEDVPRVQVEKRGGRPTVYQFLNSLDGSRSPGLFACGPVSLLNDIRRATDERCLLRYRQCIRGEANIALYEEAFEM